MRAQRARGGRSSRERSGEQGAGDAMGVIGEAGEGVAWVVRSVRAAWSSNSTDGVDESGAGACSPRQNPRSQGVGGRSGAAGGVSAPANWLAEVWTVNGNGACGAPALSQSYVQPACAEAPADASARHANVEITQAERSRNIVEWG